MSDRMPPHVREAAQRVIAFLPDDEVQAMLGAFEASTESTTLDGLLTDFFIRLGYKPADATETAQQAIAAGPLDLRAKLN